MKKNKKKFWFNVCLCVSYNKSQKLIRYMWLIASYYNRTNPSDLLNPLWLTMTNLLHTHRAIPYTPNANTHQMGFAVDDDYDDDGAAKPYNNILEKWKKNRREKKMNWLSPTPTFILLFFYIFFYKKKI